VLRFGVDGGYGAGKRFFNFFFYGIAPFMNVFEGGGFFHGDMDVDFAVVSAFARS
jgi:hypothetical protein